METWLNEDPDSIWKARRELNLNGFYLDTVDWTNGKKRAGIAIVYKDNIKQKISKHFSSTPFSLVYGD